MLSLRWTAGGLLFSMMDPALHDQLAPQRKILLADIKQQLSLRRRRASQAALAAPGPWREGRRLATLLTCEANWTHFTVSRIRHIRASPLSRRYPQSSAYFASMVGTTRLHLPLVAPRATLN
jgi:hypothetical protein